MKQPILSILICTINGREDSFGYIMARVVEQRKKLGYTQAEVEILSLKDNGEMLVGEKRNKLVDMATGWHILFIDDDDDISSNYLRAITSALLEHPYLDAIGFWGMKTTNGKILTPFMQSADSDSVFYDAKMGYFRNPINHLNPVKRSIAIDNKFPHINAGEDQVYAKLIHPHLKNTVFIPQTLYHYRFSPENTAAQREQYKNEQQ